MFRIHAGSGEPVYQQVVRQVKHAIATGVLRPGERLATVRELAAKLVINPNTVAKAYRELERDGLLETARGRGTFVRENPPVLGYEERRRRLEPELRQLVAEARALGFGDEELVRELERVLGIMGIAARSGGT